MNEFKEPTNLDFGKQLNKEEIINLLGLSKSPNLLSLQYKFEFSGGLKPWWLKEENDDLPDGLRTKYRDGAAKGFIDPVAILQSELKKNPKAFFKEIELIYPRFVLTKSGIKKIPPGMEIIDEAVKYLQKIGFNPKTISREFNPKFNPKTSHRENFDSQAIREENWVIDKDIESAEESRESYHPTIYENIGIKVVRDSNGKTESINLIAFND